MTNTIQGQLDGKGKKFAIVVGRFNEHVSGKLLSGAIDMLSRHNASEKNITVVWVPGAFEIPLITKKLAASGNYDAVICLGAIIRGSTPHFDYVSAQASRGISQVTLESSVPCIFGVLTCDTIEQAVERAGSKAGNKGSQAAMDALEMASLLDQI